MRQNQLFLLGCIEAAKIKAYNPNIVMKNLFSFLTLFIASTYASFAQCVPAEDMQQSAPFIYVDGVVTGPSQNHDLPTVYASTAYEVVLSLVAPIDITIAEPISHDGLAITSVLVDTLFIRDIEGLPLGLSWANNGSSYVLAGEETCVTISGSVENASIGTYPLTVKVSGAVTAPAFAYNLIFNTDDLVSRQNVLDFDNYSIVVEEQQVAGCTDNTAFNYNSNANTDNGTCIVVVEGCTNPIAENYITPVGDLYIDVNTDNGSCLYSSLVYEDLTELNSDLEEELSVFETVEEEQDYSMSFDGNYDYVYLGDVFDVGSNSFNISFWTSVDTFNLSTQQNIISKTWLWGYKIDLTKPEFMFQRLGNGHYHQLHTWNDLRKKIVTI